MNISKFDSWARSSGTLGLFWAAFQSKYYSLGNSGDLSGLLIFVVPLLITHWFVRKTAYYNSTPAPITGLILPVAGVTLAMMISSLLNGQSLLHEQGPSLWVYALIASLLFRLWHFEFITTICKQAFCCYGVYFLFVQLPPVQTPGSGTLRYFFENQNILGMYLVSFFLLSDLSFRKLSASLLALALFGVLIFNGSIFGSGSFLSSLVVLAGYEKLLVFALAGFSVGVLVFKQILLGHSDAVQVRLDIWKEGFQLGLQDPVFGAGHNHKIFIDLRPGVRIDHPHNFVLQIFRVSGAFGLCMTAWLLTTIVRSWKQLAVNQRAFLTFFLFWSLVDDWFVWHGSIVLFAAGATIYTDASADPQRD